MLPVETPHWRRRFVFLAVLAVSLLAFVHNLLVDRHLTFASYVHRADHPIQTPLQRIRPEFTADVNMWIRYALALLEGKEGLRSHHTDVDNAPKGREVHWNSALTWWIAGLGWTWSQVTGAPLPAAVEHAAVWANLPLLIAFITGFGWWAGRRAGALAGAMVALGVFGHRSIYEGFMPAYPDHHGLIAAGILGVMLGMLFMGGGWTRSGSTAPGLGLLPMDEKSARRAAAWGGFWGGFGLWISTASLAIPIAMVPIAGGLAALACGKSLSAAGARFHGSVWRTWGRVGALTSLGFYLLEYFPSHLGLRLEVNHPLYALSWWGGAELAACALEFLVATPDTRAGAMRLLARCARWAVPAILAPVLVILWRGTEVFAPLDPFLVRLHATIAEFIPLMMRLRLEGLRGRMDFLFIYPMVCVLALALLPFVTRPQRHGLILCLVPAILLQALGFWQGRWSLSAGSAHLPLLVACMAALYTLPFFGATRLRQQLVAGALAAFFFVPILVFYAGAAIETLSKNIVPNDETAELIYREIAQAIRDSQPTDPVVLFASPNASTSISYYGRFKALGTLYWENNEGLKSAAALNSAPGEEAALKIIRRLGVTHLALVSANNYIAEYARLLNPGLNDEGVKATFAYQLMGKGQIPLWLEPILYAPPSELRGDLEGLRVLLFKVNLEQNQAQLFYRLGLLLSLQGRDNEALQRFANAAQFDAKSSLPWFRSGEIHLKGKHWREAADAFIRAIELSEPGERYKLFTQTGVAFDHDDGTPVAMEFYRRAIALPMNNGIALNNLAWRLATSTRPALRNDPLALSYAQNAVTIEPNDTGAIDTLAVVFAANKRFPEAITTIDNAIAIATKNADTDALKIYARHRKAFSDGQFIIE